MRRRTAAACRAFCCLSLALLIPHAPLRYKEKSSSKWDDGFFKYLYLAFGEDKEAAPATWADALTKQEYVLIGCEDTDIPTDDGVIRRLQEPTGAKCEF